MALIKDGTEIELPIPHEPGEWIKIRPARTGDVEGTTGDEFDVMVQMLDKIIIAWSYPDPVTKETIRLIDIVTLRWLSEHIRGASGIRTVAEKNGSGSNSSDTSVSEAEPSLANSPTSPSNAG